MLSKSTQTTHVPTSAPTTHIMLSTADHTPQAGSGLRWGDRGSHTVTHRLVWGLLYGAVFQSLIRITRHTRNEMEITGSSSTASHINMKYMCMHNTSLSHL